MDQVISLSAEQRIASKDEAVVASSFRPLRQHEIAGPYGDYAYPDTFHYVPSLQYLCIRALLTYPDQLESFHSRRIALKSSKDSRSFDLLKALCPSHGHEDVLNLSTVDPRLWATIFQIFEPSSIPEWPTTYRLPLSDQHMKLLQQIPSTPDFSLVTVLELSACRELTDDTIFSLKYLHSLVALDASETSLSSQGIWQLCRLPQWSADEPPSMRGPWGLTMLRLRSCDAVDDKVYESLERILLLSVVGAPVHAPSFVKILNNNCAADLTNTRCHSNKIPTGFHLRGAEELFYPTRICESLSTLQSQHYGLFSSSSTYTLHIDQLTHSDRITPLTKLSADNNFGQGKKSFSSEAAEFTRSRASAGSHSSSTEDSPRGSPYLDITEEEFHSTAEDLFAADEHAFSIKLFYRSNHGASVHKPSVARHSHYSAGTRRIPSNESSPDLRLYRDPPGWRKLQTCKPPSSAMPSTRLVDTPAQLDRKSSLSKLRVQSLHREIVHARTRVEEKKHPSAPIPNTTPIASTSKNPFRSSSTSSSCSSKKLSSTSQHLKPITALKVPELSEAQRVVTKPPKKRSRTELEISKKQSSSARSSSNFDWQKWAK